MFVFTQPYANAVAVGNDKLQMEVTAATAAPSGNDGVFPSLTPRSFVGSVSPPAASTSYTPRYPRPVITTVRKPGPYPVRLCLDVLNVQTCTCLDSDNTCA